MPDRITGTPRLRPREPLARSIVLALFACKCAVYDSGLVNHADDRGTASTGSGASGKQPDGNGGQSSTGGNAGSTTAGSIGSSGGAAGAVGDESEGGAGDGIPGASGSPSGGAGTNGNAGAGVGAGGNACASGGGPPDLPVFRNGTFVPGWSTVGSWLTCNGTPIAATISATTALAVDLSCNAYNGVLLINWNSPVAQCTYATLSFDLYFANVADIGALQVYLQDTNGKVGLALGVPSLIGSPQGKAWNQVSLPLSSFGTGLVFKGVGFFNASAAGIPLFYVNNVILGVGARADSGTD